MTQILYGERIGRQGKIRLGCAAVLFDEKREKVLLTRRADIGQWCLPSGGTESGESVTETCVREFREETGLIVQVERLTSICSNQDRLVIYRRQPVPDHLFELRGQSDRRGAMFERRNDGDRILLPA